MQGCLPLQILQIADTALKFHLVYLNATQTEGSLK